MVKVSVCRWTESWIGLRNFLRKKSSSVFTINLLLQNSKYTFKIFFYTQYVLAISSFDEHSFHVRKICNFANNLPCVPWPSVRGTWNSKATRFAHLQRPITDLYWPVTLKRHIGRWRQISKLSSGSKNVKFHWKMALGETVKVCEFSPEIIAAKDYSIRKYLTCPGPGGHPGSVHCTTNHVIMQCTRCKIPLRDCNVMETTKTKNCAVESKRLFPTTFG